MKEWWNRYGARGALFLWGAGSLLIGANLLAFHLVALPQPAREDPVLSAGLATIPHRLGRWQLTHFLYADCPCSSQVADHLLKSERPNDVDEQVILVGKAPQLVAHLKRRNMTVEVIGEQELEQRFSVTAVPFLVIQDPDGRVRYSGGYSARKQGPVVEDLALLDRARNNSEPAALPIFGCAVSKELKERIDPAGLKRLSFQGFVQ